MQRHTGQRELYDLAQEQGGYFTAKQAALCGYTANKRNYHVRAGNWIREHRGIYRLALFPAPERPDLILWWLWSRGRDDAPVSVFSHRTALSLHELTDANPARLDLTVPLSFRKGAPIPPIIHLHFAALAPNECQTVAGVPTTNSLRTIIDIWQDGDLPRSILSEAFAEALRRGKVTINEVARARSNPLTAQILSEIQRGEE